MKVLKRFDEIHVKIIMQYNKITVGSSYTAIIPEKVARAKDDADEKLKEFESSTEEDVSGTSEYAALKRKCEECDKKYSEENMKAMDTWNKDTDNINFKNTYFNEKNFDELCQDFITAKTEVLKNYKNKAFTITSQTIENDHKVIDEAVKKANNDIVKGFNKYINELEKFKRKYDIKGQDQLIKF